MAQIVFSDSENAFVLEKGGGKSKAVRKCLCCCLDTATWPLRTLWSGLGIFGILVLVGLIIAVVYLADAKTAALQMASDLQTTVASYFSSGERRNFVAGAPASPWGGAWTPIASGWIEFHSDTISANVTAVAGIAKALLVGRPSAGSAYNVTTIPLGLSSALPATGLLAAWKAGDLLYLLLLAGDGSVTLTTTLPLY
jgi:hypothetical protein